jgi:hypothetical protein
LELSVCAEFKISHSHFLGGPNRWTDDDREKAIWWLRRQREACGECGTRPDEWDEKVGGHRHAYVAKYEHCRGCEVKQAADKALENDRKHYPKGMRVVLTPRSLASSKPTARRGG